MPLDYKTAMTALNDNDKNRLLAIYLNSDLVTVLPPLSASRTCSLQANRPTEQQRYQLAEGR